MSPVSESVSPVDCLPASVVLCKCQTKANNNAGHLGFIMYDNKYHNKYDNKYASRFLSSN